jgi:hypothetical protein
MQRYQYSHSGLEIGGRPEGKRPFGKPSAEKREIDCLSASREIPHRFRNPKVHCQKLVTGPHPAMINPVLVLRRSCLICCTDNNRGRLLKP